jgi:choline dehydrogenase
MLSGIGSADVLGPLGIEVLVDNPGVGANLQDHASCPLFFASTVATLHDEINARGAVKHGAKFVMGGEGSLSAAAAHAVLFGRFGPWSERPDYEIVFRPLAVRLKGSGHGSGLRAYPKSAVTLTVSLLHPSVRGEVSINSSDPTAAPLIRHQLLSEDVDRDGLIASLRTGRAIMHRDPVARFMSGEEMPGEQIESDDEWEGYVRRASHRGEHPVGTFRMGVDEGSVVDPELRVHGIDGLRVVDASVMPDMISGHTNAPTIMIAERAAEFMVR